MQPPDVVQKTKMFFEIINKHKFVSAYLLFVSLISTALLLLPGYLRSRESFSTDPAVDEAKVHNKYEELVNKGAIEKAYDILEITFRYSGSGKVEKLSVIDAIIKKGYLTDIVDEKDLPYKLVILKEDENLFSKSFQIPNKVLGPPPLSVTEEDTSDLIELTELDFVITIPYFPDADNLAVLKSSGDEVVSYSLQNLKTNNEKIDFESSEGNVLSISSDLAESVNRVKTLFASDVKAQSHKGYVDVVFIGDKYSLSQTELYKTNVQKIIDDLLEYEPFKSRSSQFLFHTIENTSDLGCSYSGRVIVCNTSKIMSLVNSAGIPHDLIAVIVNNETYGGSAFYPYNGNPGIATSYNGALWSSEVMVHEIGHALGYLEDEYIANSPAQPGTRNCFRSGGMLPELWEDLTGSNIFINGCNYSYWSRSTETSIMRSVEARYFNPISRYFLDQEIERFAGSPVLPSPTASSPTVTVTLSPKPSIAGGATNTPTPLSGNSVTATGILLQSTVTPTSGLASVSTATPTVTSLPTSAPTLTPTPTGIPNCLKGITMSLQTSSQTASRGETINNNLLVTNNNDIGCGSSASMGISWANPSVWVLTPSTFSISINAGETKYVPFSIYIKPEAPTGSNIYQLWVASFGPSNGTVNVQ